MKFLATIPKAKLQQMMLVVLLSFGGAVGLAYFFVGQQYSEWVQRNETIAKLTADIERDKSDSTKTVLNEQQREAIRTFVQTQEVVMVNGDPFLWVVREISLLAEQHPVRIQNLQPGSRAPHVRLSRYETYITRIDLTGTYDQIGLFLKDLENRFPEGEIRSLDMAAGESQHRASIELILLMRPQQLTEKQATAPPAAAEKKS